MPFLVEVRISPFHPLSSRDDLIFLPAEDVLGDLGVRQAMRKMPKTARL
jgi:hypothetical protein